jgi:glycosyltransferase involved in cell wall biosynthesis
MTIKNEWPLAAVSISHALINHVDKIYVVDNGSQDGTWQGLKILQDIFPDRIVVIYYESELFNQRAISHALGHLEYIQDNQLHWAITLDADEFLVKKFPEPLKEYLEIASESWNSIALMVENFIPSVDFQEDDLNSFQMIEYKTQSYFDYYQLQNFDLQARAGKLYWQQRRTQSKLFYDLKLRKRLGHACHQVEYGNCIRMITHDPGTAINTSAGLFFIAHLPYTSLRRLKNRTVLRHTEKSGEEFRFFLNDDVNSLESLFTNMTIDKNSKFFSNSLSTENVIKDSSFSETIVSVFPVLGPRWQEIVLAPSVKSESSNQQFALLVDMAAEYIAIADKLWLEKM